MKESMSQDLIRAALGEVRGAAIYRNNVGVARHFDPRTHREQVVRYGLFPGSADLIGVYRGRFVSLEVKSDKGTQTEAQRQWGRVVQLAGGLHRVVRTPGDALAAIKEVEDARERVVSLVRAVLREHGVLGGDGGLVPCARIEDAADELEARIRESLP